MISYLVRCSCGFILAITSSIVFAKPFSDLIVFSGPLEDTGNYASVYGDFPPPFYQNRFSNGPLAIEYLAEELGIELKPSLHRIGPVQGNNFASVDAFAHGDDPKDLPGQVTAYLDSVGGKADREALFYVIIGGNEVIEATYEQSDIMAYKLIKASVDAKIEAIMRLHRAGAKYIYTADFIDVALTPKVMRDGLEKRGTAMSNLHNRLYDHALNKLERKIRDIEIYRSGFAAMASNVINNADILRFWNTTEPCLELLATGDCDFDTTIFFNDLFPTARVHKYWGYDLITTLLEQRNSGKHSHKPGRSKIGFE